MSVDSTAEIDQSTFLADPVMCCVSCCFLAAKTRSSNDARRHMGDVGDEKGDANDDESAVGV
jgi:hypothetical protein